jgi:hypothetical protein
MASPAQLSQLRALLRSLKYMFAIASLVAVAGIVFLATVHARVTTDVLIGMVLCLCILLTGAFFGWFALWRDPRLRFLHADGLRVRPRRTRLPVIGKVLRAVTSETKLILSRAGPSACLPSSPWQCSCQSRASSSCSTRDSSAVYQGVLGWLSLLMLSSR